MIQEKIFTEDECIKIISFTEKYLRGYHLNNKEINQDNILYKGYVVPKNNETIFLFEKLFSFFENKTGIKLYKYPQEMYIHKSDVGDKFIKHNDARWGRLYSIGILLNTDFEGGEFFIENETTNKIVGNAYYFDAYKIHEVKEITKGTRWSLISFISDVDLYDFKEKKMI